MKIIQLIDTLSLGGAERMAVNIANVCAENNIESCLIATHRGGALSEFILPQVQFNILNKKNSKDFKAFLKLKKIVKTFKPNIIHAHSSSVFWACFLKLFFPKIKIIWHDHFGLSNELEKHPRKNYIFLSKWIDAIISVNTILEKWALEHCKTKTQNIKYIANFPYLNTITKQPTEENIILNLANFRPQKNQIVLVEAVKLLVDKNINLHVYLAGGLVDDVWVEKVKNKIKELQLEKYITITGPVNNVSDILGKATIGVLSSDSEGLPVSLLEYGLATLPVVSTRVGECSVVLENGKYGLLVESNQALALANAIETLIQNKQQAIEFGNKFEQHILNKYGAKGFMNEYQKIINTLC